MPRAISHTVAVIKALGRLPSWTRQELADAAGVDRERISLLITELHAAGAVHISSWTETTHGRPLAVYSLGPGKDAKKRTALTGKERTAAYNARQRQRAQATLQQAILAMARQPEGALDGTP